MNNKVVINLYGGPGTGKLTTAAHLFALMKQKGSNTELVMEYVNYRCLKAAISYLKRRCFNIFFLQSVASLITRLVGIKQKMRLK